MPTNNQNLTLNQWEAAVNVALTCRGGHIELPCWGVPSMDLWIDGHDPVVVAINLLEDGLFYLYYRQGSEI